MHICRICGWSGDAPSITVKEMQFNTRQEFQYFECGNCHCLQIESIPENLGSCYGDNYYSNNNPLRNSSNTQQITNPTRILDVGCGAGYFLCQLAQAGYTSLDGCDPFIEKDIIYENGVHIYKREIHDMKGPYDGIYFNDSFEHVTDPHEVMDSIKRLLSPNGIARIKIPVYPNIAYDMFGADWFQIDAPRHIILHSKQSMDLLAAKHGLSIIKRDYDSNASQILSSYLYSVGIPLWEQTDELVHKHFSKESLLDIIESCKIANQNEYGDHAIFYLTHSSK